MTVWPTHRSRRLGRFKVDNPDPHNMDTWSAHIKKFHDKHGGRWYFMFHHRYLDDREPDEQPYVLHFRNDERTIFGVLRFEHSKDNPYASFAAVTRKIMDDDDFRALLVDDGSKKVWKGR